MELKPSWFSAIDRRVSRRRFSGELPAEGRARVEAFCRDTGAAGAARVELVAGDAGAMFTGLVGGYGAVSGMPLVAALIARDGAEADVGYLGEALILEATDAGLATCWIAGSFDRDRVATLVGLRPGERVVAVTPLGLPRERFSGGERLFRRSVRAATRLGIDRIAPGIDAGSWPRWALTATEAARRAPSGKNLQPWRFRFDGDGLVLSQTLKRYWTAPIDMGIARLHVELGAHHEGVGGAWQSLTLPDVARFVPHA